MPQKKRRQKTPAEEHTFLAIRIERYEASVEAAVNHNVYAPQLAWNSDDDHPLYEFTTRLTIVGVATYPVKRAGDTCDFTIYGDNVGSGDIRATLKDVQARDEHGSPKHRSYRGRQGPDLHIAEGNGAHRQNTRRAPLDRLAPRLALLCE